MGWGYYGKPPSQRPERWIRNPASPLYGATFLGLGPNELGSPGTTLYEDSSLYGRHGALTNYSGAALTPAENWRFESRINRWILRMYGANPAPKVLIPDIVCGTVASAALWVYKYNTNEYPVFCGTTYSAGGYFLSIGASTTYISANGTYAGINYTMPSNTWKLVAVTRNGKAVRFFVDGTAIGDLTLATNTAGPTIRSIACYDTGTIAYFGMFCDTIIANGTAWSPENIAALADPSNVDLRVDSVPLILSIRRFWPVVCAPAVLSRRRRSNANRNAVIGD